MRYLAFLVLSAALAPAATIYTDNFDSSVIGLNTAPTGWSVSNGTVDVVSVPNQWVIVCLGGSGACVDLDGSTGDSGVLTSQTFDLAAGGTYTLSFYLSGNQRNSGDDTVTVSFGGVTQNYTLAGTDGFTKYSLVVNPASNLSNQAITFENAGGDNIGLILDSVSLDAELGRTGQVPEPSTMAFAGIALLSAGWLKFRKRSN